MPGTFLSIVLEMECLVLEKNEDVRNNLCVILIALGLKGIPAATNEEALSKIKSCAELFAVIIDVDNKSVAGMELFEKLKTMQEQNELAAWPRIILHSANSGKGFVTQMISAGIHGYLLKPFDKLKAEQKLRRFLLFQDEHAQEKRRCLRVTCNEELLRVSFRLDTVSPLYAGRIRNISMGGMAVELFNLKLSADLRKGQKISHLVFYLGTKSFSPQAEICFIQAQIVAFSFLSLTSQERGNLAGYIFKKINPELG